MNRLNRSNNGGINNAEKQRKNIGKTKKKHWKQKK